MNLVVEKRERGVYGVFYQVRTLIGVWSDQLIFAHVGFLDTALSPLQEMN